MHELAIDSDVKEVVPVVREKRTQADSEVNGYLKSVLGDYTGDELTWIKAGDDQTIETLPANSIGIGIRSRINDFHHLNSFLKKANDKLNEDQILVVNLETKDSRKARIFNKFPKPISLPYYGLDFILKRVFPKWGPTKKIYFKLTNGRNRVLSITEGLARLIASGFKIVDYKKIGYRTYVIAKKVKEPSNEKKRSYGVLIKLKRVGLHGKMIDVYKMRTMHPYSEYLQEYMYERNNLDEDGKIKDDFRTTSWGRIFRKYWIDELPMFINFFRGEMKLVGVRPLSKHYFNLYPEDLKKLRTQNKPGLIPPYYADMPNGIEEVQESERNYLIMHKQKPIRTDIRYFFKVFYNIIFRGARSG